MFFVCATILLSLQNDRPSMKTFTNKDKCKTLFVSNGLQQGNQNDNH